MPVIRNVKRASARVRSLPAHNEGHQVTFDPTLSVLATMQTFKSMGAQVGGRGVKVASKLRKRNMRRPYLPREINVESSADFVVVFVLTMRCS